MNLETMIAKFFLSYEGGVSPATIKWYRHYLAPLSALGEKPITEIEVDDLRKLYVTLASEREEPTTYPNSHKSIPRKYSPYTLHCFARSWRRLFHWATEEGYLTTSPAKRLRLPALPDPDPKAISRADFQKIMIAAQQLPNPLRNRALVRFLADTNARVGGVAGLRLSRLDVEKREARVSEKGKGGNGKSRMIYFSQKTAQMLAEWLSVRPETTDDRVFLLSTTGIYQVLKRLGKWAGVESPHSPHAFRHAFALGMLEKGANLGQVSQLMGHSDISVTAKNYGQFAERHLHEFHERYTWVSDDEDGEDTFKGEQSIGSYGHELTNWITIQQGILVAEKLGTCVPRGTIRHAANRGFILYALKCGRDWLMPRTEFLTWLKYRYHPRKYRQSI